MASSNNALTDAQKVVRQNKKACLANLCEVIHRKVTANNGRMPYGYMGTFLEENRKSFDWLTRDIINSAYTRFKKRRSEFHSDREQPTISEIHLDEKTSAFNSTSLSDLSTSESRQYSNWSSRAKGGRPSGSSNSNKRRRKDEIIAMKNDIARDYQRVKASGKRAKWGELKQIIERHKIKRNLEEVHIPEATIRMRVQRNHSIVHHDHHGGLQSPLLELDDTVVKVALMMARIRQCLSPSKGLALVNSLIDNQPIQQKLIEWKRKFSSNSDGTVGYRYWRGLMKRNKHRLVSKRGQKYSLDRQNWTTYHNFLHMYEHTYEEMVSAGVAECLTEPLWVDENGNECEEEDSCGCQVKYRLTHPDRCFVGDEVGGNISMKGDGHAAGKLLLGAPESVAYDRVSVTEKRFTMIGLTALDGSPVMCILIIAQKVKDLSIETGIDITVNPDGDPKDGDHYFFNNSGPGKYFPGPPTCTFRGKEIPALVRWNESGNITSDILVEALSTLDVMKVIPRNDNVKPFLQLDGHGSRLELPFLNYINTPEDHWVVCLGVPYGTALWQVGDSKEQNGAFNIAFTKAKQDLLKFKITKMTDSSLRPTDLIPLINIAWNKSFARIDTNRKAIAARGWNPLNYHLLMDPELRATMTASEIQNESCKIILPSSMKPNQVSASSSSINNETSSTSDAPPDSHNIETTGTQQSSLNFSTGVSAECLNALVGSQQLMEARERIKREKANGEDLATRLKAAKRITAGFVWKEGTNRLGKTVFEVCKEKHKQKKELERKKKQKQKKDYFDLKHKADALLSSGKEVSKMSNKDLSTILKSLRRDGDKRLPTKKNEMLRTYEEWKERKPLEFDSDNESLSGTDSEIEIDDTNVDISDRLNIESV